MALIHKIIDIINHEYSLPEPKFSLCKMKDTELEYLKEECSRESEFDPFNKRKSMISKFLKGEAKTLFIRCEFGKIFCIFDDVEQIAELPIGLWVRILRMYSENKKMQFKVFFLAVKDLREFPKGSEPITPENINGGYTYRCEPDKIIIYRAEDATRVLIHELMHSCCLDKPENDVDIVEAETEAWAELIYVGLISQGKKYLFNDLIKRQSEWIRKQNAEVRKHMIDANSREFPWRYTIGKEEVWKRWGILSTDDLKPPLKIGNSLRLTYPPNSIIKERFKVSKNSSIL